MDIRSLITNVVPILTIIGWALGAYIVLLWAASVLWTYRDILCRSVDVVVQVLAVARALLLPFAGVLLHMILRPRRQTRCYERKRRQSLRGDPRSDSRHLRQVSNETGAVGKPWR